MNLGKLIALYRSRSLDIRKPYFCKDDELIEFFQEAQDEAATRARLLFDKTAPFTEIPVAKGETMLPLSPKIVEIRRAALVDVEGKEWLIVARDRDDMDRERPGWRTETRRPDAFFHDDTGLELNAIPETDYTLKLEVYRLPLRPFSTEEHAPEIAEHHHRHLLDWVLYRAYEKEDAELFNPAKSKESLERFERHFGRRKTANMRKRQQASRPHRNVSYS